MQTLILNHYPPVIKQIREVRQIANAEDIEFLNLNASINEVLRNMFVLTANEYGVARFEKLLKIRPKAEQSLQERKTVILSMSNRRKMSLTELETMLAGHSPGLKLLPDSVKQEMDVVINVNTGNIRIILQILEEILPLNIYIRFVCRLCSYVPVHYKNAVQVSIRFYPRHPFVLLKLNGRWKLDGTHRLSVYDSDDFADYYPVRTAAGIQMPVRGEWETGAAAGARADAGTDYRTGMSARTVVYIRGPKDCRGRLQAAVHTSVLAGPSADDGSVRIINKLDGRWKLDGSRKLNAGIYPL